MKNITDHKYFGVFAAAAITFIGVLFFHWQAYQIFFFLWLQHVIKIPSIFIFHKKMKNVPGGRGGFAIVFIGGFIVYTLLFMLLTYRASGMFYGDFYEPFLYEFYGLFGSYGIGVIGIIIVQILNHRAIDRKVKWDEQIGDNFAFRHLFYMGTMGALCLLLAQLYSNSFLTYYSGSSMVYPLVLIVAGFELWWTEKRPIYHSSKKFL